MPMMTSPHRTTAYPAAGGLRRAVIQLTYFLRFRSPDASLASSDDVDGGKQADPDDIDEVPVVGHHDGADLLFLGEGLGGEGPSQQEKERHQPAGNVQAVESGGDIEHRPVAAGRQRQVIDPDQAQVLIPLAE